MMEIGHLYLYLLMITPFITTFTDYLYILIQYILNFPKYRTYIQLYIFTDIQLIQFAVVLRAVWYFCFIILFYHRS